MSDSVKTNVHHMDLSMNATYNTCLQQFMGSKEMGLNRGNSCKLTLTKLEGTEKQF